MCRMLRGICVDIHLLWIFGNKAGSFGEEVGVFGLRREDGVGCIGLVCGDGVVCHY